MVIWLYSYTFPRVRDDSSLILKRRPHGIEQTETTLPP